uniref:lysine histidine transporter-like 7 n=1 Tax=Erigeron canadensis TaxID=72917 RepID=UPI001CB9C05D|nr:lysine histidine transporter-like 7 [Erigeron canadensis]
MDNKNKNNNNKIHIINDEGDIINMQMLQNNLITIKSKQPAIEAKENNNVGTINQPTDDWFPITRSRKGNSWTATFHLLSSGIGTQALSLPLAFVYLGWFWGIVCLFVAYIWQLYTIGLLLNLHETVSGIRYSRYLELSIAAFGAKLGKLFALLPVMYLSGGTCVLLIITGGRTMKLFYQLLCDEDCSSKNQLTTTEWFLVFVCLAILVSLFCSNLHSVAFVSFLGATVAVA